MNNSKGKMGWRWESPFQAGAQIGEACLKDHVRDSGKWLDLRVERTRIVRVQRVTI